MPCSACKRLGHNMSTCSACKTCLSCEHNTENCSLCANCKSADHKKDTCPFCEWCKKVFEGDVIANHRQQCPKRRYQIITPRLLEALINRELLTDVH